MTTSSDDKFHSTFKFSGNNYDEAVHDFPQLVDALALMAGKNKVGHLLSEELVRAHMAEPAMPAMEDEYFSDGHKNRQAREANKLKKQNYEADMNGWRKRRDAHDQEWATLQTCLGSLLLPRSNAYTLFKSAKVDVIKFQDQFAAQWKALSKWEPKLSSDVEILVEKLKSLDDSSGWGKFEGEWNDVIGELKNIKINDKVAIPEDVNDIFAKAITNTNMRVMVIADYYEGKEDTKTWEMMMGRISKLIRKNKDWDTIPKGAQSVKISALSTSTDIARPGKRGNHCFMCGSMAHFCNACNAHKCETCGKLFGNKEERKDHINNCPNRIDTDLKRNSKPQGGGHKRKFEKYTDSKPSHYGPTQKKNRPWGNSGRTVVKIDAKNAKVIAEALQAIQRPSGLPDQGKA